MASAPTGNISGEATIPPGNNLLEATRHFVCLRQPHGILAPKDIKAAFRCEVRHAKVRGPG